MTSEVAGKGGTVTSEVAGKGGTVTSEVAGKGGTATPGGSAGEGGTWASQRCGCNPGKPNPPTPVLQISMPQWFRSLRSPALSLLFALLLLTLGCAGSRSAVPASQVDAASKMLGGEPDLIVILRPRAMVQDAEFNALLRCTRSERKRITDRDLKLLEQIEEVFVAVRHDSDWHSVAWLRGGQDFGPVLEEAARDEGWRVEHHGDEYRFHRSGQHFLLRKTRNGWIGVSSDLEGKQGDLASKIDASSSSDALALLQVRGPIVTIAGALAELKVAQLRGIGSHLRAGSIELRPGAVAQMVIEFDDASAVDRLVELRSKTGKLREGTDVSVRGNSVIVSVHERALGKMCEDR